MRHLIYYVGLFLLALGLGTHFVSWPIGFAIAGAGAIFHSIALNRVYCKRCKSAIDGGGMC